MKVAHAGAEAGFQAPDADYDAGFDAVAVLHMPNSARFC